MKTFRMLIFLPIFYLITPIVSYGGIPLGDIVFIIVLILYFFRKDHVFVFKNIFYIIFYVILLSRMFNLAFGGVVTSEDILNLFTHFKLALLANIIYCSSYHLYNNQYSLFEKYNNKFINYILVASIFLILIGLAQFYNIISVNEITSILYTRIKDDSSNYERVLIDSRIASVFHGANAFGGYLSIIFIFLLVFKEKIQKKFFYFNFAAILISLLLTGNRASIVALSFFIFAYSAYTKNLIKMLIVAVVISLIAFSYNDMFYGQNYDRISELSAMLKTGELPSNLEYRIDIVPQIWRFINENASILWYGGGIQKFRSTLMQSYENSYLGLVLKYGVIGTCIIIGWFIFILYRFSKHLKKEKLQQSYALLMMSIVVMLLIISTSQDIFFLERWRELFFSIIGIGTAIIQQKRCNEQCENVIS